MAWTTPRTWVDGETETASILNTHIRDNFAAIGSAWTSYVPVWTASTTNPVLNNGTLTGSYVSAGKLTHVRIALTVGSTTTIGSGNYMFSLPVTPISTVRMAVGTAYLYDSSAPAAAARIVTIEPAGTTVFLRDTAGALVTNAVPWTWAQSDTIGISVTLESA